MRKINKGWGKQALRQATRSGTDSKLESVKKEITFH